MRYLEVLYHPFLKGGVFGLLKAKFSFDIFSYKFSKKLSNLIKQAKNSTFLKNTVLFVCLFAFPLAAVVTKDYVNDWIERREIAAATGKSLISSTTEYAKLLTDLKDKILSEKLYSSLDAVHKLLVDVSVLKAHGTPAMRKLEGLRWVSADLKAIGLYGAVHNFDPRFFLNFLRSLDQTPNRIQIINLNKTIYLGMGIARDTNIIGHLLLPLPPEIMLDSQNTKKLRILQISSELIIPSQGISLDELMKNPSSHFNLNKTMKWNAYTYENGLAFVAFFLFACCFLFFKRKNDRKRNGEISLLHQKGELLTNNLLAQQRAANFIITRLHEVNESIGEISNLFVETHTSTTVFTPQEQMNFVRKVCDFSSEIEKKIIKNGKIEPVNIKDIVSNCINFYGYKLSEANIDVKQEYHLAELSFSSAKDAFNQLIMNLYHMALERTPENGNILITVKRSETEKNERFILIIEDNGYSFSSKELKHYKKSNRPIFEDYFDLGWERILELARHINCRVSDEKISPVGNRITLIIQEHQALKNESKYEEYATQNNIIKLFPAS